MGRPVKLRVVVTKDEHHQLMTLTRQGQSNARVIRRAHVLLLSHEGKKVRQIMEALHVTSGTVHVIRKKYCEGGLEQALFDQPRSGRREIGLE
ncbi:helix-turn-helix domain-containing protein [Deinococcus cavernae]|uniref:Helix-turn-helix domain-containing protein n=1 Tax=Deinococcus cavernae TaxID=2320857 RepID=A0A418VH41_9DEIO|nr:helix-turn-helix domain-containing protein [Deinococcus cavernae]